MPPRAKKKAAKTTKAAKKAPKKAAKPPAKPAKAAKPGKKAKTAGKPAKAKKSGGASRAGAGGMAALLALPPTGAGAQYVQEHGGAKAPAFQCDKAIWDHLYNKERFDGSNRTCTLAVCTCTLDGADGRPRLPHPAAARPRPGLDAAAVQLRAP